VKNVRSLIITAIIITAFLAAAGCTGNSPQPGSSYTVSPEGVLSLTCGPVTTDETVIVSNASYTKSRIVLHTENGDVVTYLSVPESPKAAVVYSPGAGETVAGHDARMARFASEGYAFLFTDTRGNGGETSGMPFGQQMVQSDYTLFEKGAMPQYYLSVCDLVAAQELLSERYHVPVYAMGSSNGGRYAAVAAGVDPGFAGYVGISTSDWGLRESLIGQGISGEPLRFTSSIEPGTYIGRIAPRPVWIFYSTTDPIIPVAEGKELFEKANDPRFFREFEGSHGINSDVDEKILQDWAQIYAPRG